MEGVGVLLGVIARDFEEGGAGLFIDGYDLADDPVSRSEGTDDFAILAVDEVKMVIAGAFAEPEDLVFVGEDAVVAITEDVDEFVGGFLDDDALEAGVGVDFDEAVFPEAALDVGHGEEVLLIVPAEVVDGVGIFGEGGASRDGLALVGEEDDGVGDVKFVAGFGIGVELVRGLDLILWGGAHEVDLGDGVVGAVGEGKAGGVGVPADAGFPAGVFWSLAEILLLSGFEIDEDGVFLECDFPFLVRRGAA